MMNLSHKASSPSPRAGNSLLAATRSFRGSLISFLPFLKSFSLITVSNEFCIAGPAFHISSRNTTSELGKYPSVARSYISLFFSREIDTGPNISSGVENLDMRYSNDRALRNALFSLRATMLFATPGGPRRIILSPAIAARRDRLISESFSYIFLFISLMRLNILCFISILEYKVNQFFRHLIKRIESYKLF